VGHRGPRRGHRQDVHPSRNRTISTIRVYNEKKKDHPRAGGQGEGGLEMFSLGMKKLPPSYQRMYLAKMHKGRRTSCRFAPGDMGRRGGPQKPQIIASGEETLYERGGTVFQQKALRRTLRVKRDRPLCGELLSVKKVLKCRRTGRVH